MSNTVLVGLKVWMVDNNVPILVKPNQKIAFDLVRPIWLSHGFTARSSSTFRQRSFNRDSHGP